MMRDLPKHMSSNAPVVQASQAEACKAFSAGLQAR
jgi:hypothetical protein